MSLPTRILAVLCAGLSLAGMPAQAQSRTASDVRFFERVAIGPLELTPIGIVRDQRCADPRFCYRPEDMRVSVILHDRRYPYEVVLRLGQAVEVAGGYLVLRDPGTRPRDRGALRLGEYALDIEFIPAPRRNRRS
jgi:hypothetical protein